ncbi:MAG: deaminase [Nanoarchaeota archaeon]
MINNDINYFFWASKDRENAAKERVKKDDVWMNFVIRNAEHHSKCKRAKYLSIIIDDKNRLVGMGWNGKPAGSICDDVCFREGLESNSAKDIICCVHSEINCLLNTNRQDRFRGTMYVNGIPCQNCMVVILNSNLKRLVYLDNEEGHRGDGDLFWKRYGLDMEIIKYEKDT